MDSDVLFRMPSLYLAEAHTAAGGRTHPYELRRPSPGPGGALGARHAVDVPLLFGTFDSPAGRLLLGEGEPSTEALRLAEEIRGSWAAFARHGDPGWPLHGPDRRATRRLDAEVCTAPCPEERSRRVRHGQAFDPFGLT
ncbi:hypothetical protein WEB32_32215 [Streptomyces netropsis]|uniref:hypothetical protein n=1 Tax=Streptomyces netropsis TaxID=55404 RepID=UPI0030CBCDF1